MTTEAATIHVVDDDASIRTAMARLLRAAGYQVVLYDSAKHLLEALPGQQRGCILLDVQMPELSGPQLQEALSRNGFALPIIFVTGHGDIPTSVKVIKAGADDFLTKPVARDTLLEAIERALLHYDANHEKDVRLKEIRELVSALTPREREVFSLVVRGKLNKQIAHMLGTSERTIKAHRHNIVYKLKAQSTAALVSIADRLGMVTGSD